MPRFLCRICRYAMPMTASIGGKKVKWNAAIALLLLSTTALACDKIDYVEVKDWPLAKVERAYCKDLTEFTRRLLENSMRYGSQYAPQGAAAIEVCETQVKLYRRVIENIHKRQAPPC